MSDEIILSAGSQDEIDSSKFDRVNPIIEKNVSKLFVREMGKGDVLPVLTGEQVVEGLREGNSTPEKAREKRQAILRTLPKIRWLIQIDDGEDDVASNKFTPNLKEHKVYLKEQEIKIANQEQVVKNENTRFKNKMREPIKIDDTDVEVSDEDLHTYTVVARALAESPILRNGVTVSNGFFIEKYIIATNKCTPEQAKIYFEDAKRKKMLCPLDNLEDDKTYYCLNDIKEKEEN